MTAVSEARATTAPSVRAWRGASFSWYWPLGVFLLTRVAAFVFIAVASKSQIAVGFDTFPDVVRNGFPPYFVYQELPADPGYLGVVTNWDGQWFQAIATDGYQVPTGSESATERFTTMWTWAFPPGFPMVVRAVMAVTGLSFAWSMTVVNLVAGALAMVVWFRVLDRAGGRALATAGTLLACTFVTAPLFQAAYSEALGMLFLGLALWAIQHHRYLLAIAPVSALAMTRLITPVLAVVVAVQIVERVRREGFGALRGRRAVAPALLCAVAVGTTFLWSAIASVVLGHNEGFQRTSMLAGEYRFGWFASAFKAAGATGLVLVLLIAGLLVLSTLSTLGSGWGLELRTWAIAYPWFLLTFTPMHTGILRYLLLAPTLGLLVVGTPGPNGLSRARWCAVGLAAAAGLVCQFFWVGASLAVTSTTPLMP